MIGFLAGSLAKKLSNQILIDVSGVGYEVIVSNHTLKRLPKINDSIKILCFLSIRENAHVLYGFLEELERSLFKALIKVNGIGPKLAIGILSYLTPREIIAAVQNDAVKTLTSIPGIGVKSAERLLVELKDILTKLEADKEEIGIEQLDIASDATQEAINALISLGFKQNEVRQVVYEIKSEGKTSQDIIKQALKALSRN